MFRNLGTYVTHFFDAACNLKCIKLVLGKEILKVNLNRKARTQKKWNKEMDDWSVLPETFMFQVCYNSFYYFIRHFHAIPDEIALLIKHLSFFIVLNRHHPLPPKPSVSHVLCLWEPRHLVNQKKCSSGGCWKWKLQISS